MAAKTSAAANVRSARIFRLFFFKTTRVLILEAGRWGVLVEGIGMSERGVEVGCMLDRSSNRIALTEEGRIFLFDSRKLLAMCAETVATVQQMDLGKSRQLNIGYIANIHYGLLPATLGALRKLYPRVALNLFDMTATEQYQALDSFKIDLGFVGLHPELSTHDLLSECVAYDTILLALAEDNPLAKSVKIKLASLESQFFIGMSPETHPGALEWLSKTCQGAGFAANILQEADVEPTAIRFVSDRLGVALVPEQIKGLSHEGVVFRPLYPPHT